MFIYLIRHLSRSPQTRLSLTGAIATLLLLAALPVTGQEATPPLQVTVNSNADTVTPDAAITLREAILLTTGALPLAELSTAEQDQVTTLNPNAAAQIHFDLPANATMIALTSPLPALSAPGLILDGTTQPGYDPAGSATAEIMIPIPVVSLTPAPGAEVWRGLTIVADGVTVRGLSLYGFTSTLTRTATTPPADIFIAHAAPPPDTSQQQPPTSSQPFGRDRDRPPQAVTITDNWLGIPPDQSLPPTTSAFGVSVFNSLGTTIQRNYIANHDGSGIITGVRAQNLQVIENIIVQNGLAGMPDGIRLEGDIDQSLIGGNIICGNDGSGIYAFKPEGSATIQANQISYNGRRYRRSAVHLMGSGHRVIGNDIRYQTGAGVTIAAYPTSDRNVIQDNTFYALEGLSIDLNTANNVTVSAFQTGDGPNPPANSAQRRRDTGNRAIAAPTFAAREFGLTDAIKGTAAPGAEIQLYTAAPLDTPYAPPLRYPGYGDLLEPIALTTADASGAFEFNLNLSEAQALSATATLPDQGTSEPTPLIYVGQPVATLTAAALPQCVTAYVPPVPEPLPEEPLTLSVPRNIHFALDRAEISADSAAVLDQIAAVLVEYPFLTIELQGHTDPRASYEYNQDLSNRRAIAARNYLLRQGIATERMIIRGFSESQRYSTGSSVVDFARDRRVEVIFRDLRGLDITFERQEADLQVE